MKVEVTGEILRVAQDRNSSHCMIAEAVKAASPGNHKYVTVDLQCIRYTDSKRGKRYTHLTPPLAQARLVQFDLGVPQAPFSFILDHPIQIRKAHSRKGSKHGIRSPKRKLDPKIVSARVDGNIVIKGGANAVPTAACPGTARIYGLKTLKV